MKKFEEQLNKFFIKYKKVFFYIFLTVVLGYIFYNFYLIFNPLQDSAYEKKVREELKATEVSFDKKTIEKIRLRNNVGQDIPKVQTGRDPFLP